MFDITVPCKIGDHVWCIRRFHGVVKPMLGEVTQMYFSNDMKIIIVVKYIGAGEWGKRIFPTYEAAMEALSHD